MPKFTIKSSYTNPEGLTHTVIEEATDREWAQKKYDRQIGYFYYLLFGDDNERLNDAEQELKHLKSWCNQNNRHFKIRMRKTKSKLSSLSKLLINLKTDEDYYEAINIPNEATDIPIGSIEISDVSD